MGCKGEAYGADEGAGLGVGDAVAGGHDGQDTVGVGLVDHVIEGDLDAALWSYVSTFSSVRR